MRARLRPCVSRHARRQPRARESFFRRLARARADRVRLPRRDGCAPPRPSCPGSRRQRRSTGWGASPPSMSRARCPAAPPRRSRSTSRRMAAATDRAGAQRRHSDLQQRGGAAPVSRRAGNGSAATTSSWSSSRTAAATAPPALLAERAATPWGRRQLRWIHQDDAHELRCTNAGMAIARGRLRRRMAGRHVPARRLAGAGIVRRLRQLSGPRPAQSQPRSQLHSARRADCYLGGSGGLAAAAEHDRSGARQLVSPAGSRHRHQAVDGPAACLDRVGPLDEAFRPTEWDEADLAYRIREPAGRWRPAATSGWAATCISAARPSARRRRRISIVC